MGQSLRPVIGRRIVETLHVKFRLTSRPSTTTASTLVLSPGGDPCRSGRGGICPRTDAPSPLVTIRPA
jgi:hypothetical protein